MVRPNLLKSYNSKIRTNGPLDDLIENFGGTIFHNSYTPAPDTPRSLACLHSGLYPERNGCNTRIKWPYYYFKEKNSLLESLVEKDFHVSFYATKNKTNVGPIPKGAKQKINIYNCLFEFEKNVNKDLKNQKNSAYFLTLDDYHWGNDDYGHNSLGDYYGQLHLKNYIESFFNNNNQDIFDYVFWFSDHGHKLYSETKNTNINSLLNDDRSKIHLLVRKKGQNQLSHDYKLRCVFDIYPTVLNIINKTIDVELDGVDLYGENGHDYIVFEDHSDFSVSMAQIINCWAVRTNDKFYFESLKSKELYDVVGINKYKKKNKIQDELLYTNLIRRHTSSYDETTKQFAVLEFYKELRADNEDLRFSDNSRRFFKNRNFILKIITYILKDLKKRW